jgi:hypothetical protein
MRSSLVLEELISSGSGLGWGLDVQGKLFKATSQTSNPHPEQLG